MFKRRAVVGSVTPVEKEDWVRISRVKEKIAFEPDKYLYFRCRIMTGDSSNANGDIFEWPELKKAYSTFIGKPLDIEHDTQKVVGKVLDAVAIEEGKYIEGLVAVDKVKFPEIAQEIRDGKINAVSMEVNVQEAECSICGSIAHDTSELCEHMNPNSPKFVKGKVVDGKIIHEANRGLEFTGLALVKIPADGTARVFEVYGHAKKDNNEFNAKVSELNEIVSKKADLIKIEVEDKLKERKGGKSKKMADYTLSFVPGKNELLDGAYYLAVKGDRSLKVDARIIIPLEIQQKIASGSTEVITPEESIAQILEKRPNFESFRTWAKKRKKKIVKKVKKELEAKKKKKEEPEEEKKAQVVAEAKPKKEVEVEEEEAKVKKVEEKAEEKKEKEVKAEKKKVKEEEEVKEQTEKEVKKAQSPQVVAPVKPEFPKVEKPAVEVAEDVKKMTAEKKKKEEEKEEEGQEKEEEGQEKVCEVLDYPTIAKQAAYENWSLAPYEIEPLPRPKPPALALSESEVVADTIPKPEPGLAGRRVKDYYGRFPDTSIGEPTKALRPGEASLTKVLKENEMLKKRIAELEGKERKNAIIQKVWEIVATLKKANLLSEEEEDSTIKLLGTFDLNDLEKISNLIKTITKTSKVETTEEVHNLPQIYETLGTSEDYVQELSKIWNK